MEARHQLIAFYMPFTRMLAAKALCQAGRADVGFNGICSLQSIGLIEAIDSSILSWA